jgi:hypothetical protein
VSRRSAVATAVALAALAALTVAAGLVLAGKIPLAPGRPGGGGRIFYVVAYHYGFAFYDVAFNEREAIEVRAGETVTLRIVPSHALPRESVLAYAERSAKLSIGGLPPGDPRIREKIAEDFALGNVEHIVGIAGHPVYVATDVTPLLGGRPFREGAPRTLREAVERGDPAIKSVTFTAKRVGAFDVLCVDSGMDGAGTCGWGHKWMVAKGAFVVH